MARRSFTWTLNPVAIKSVAKSASVKAQVAAIAKRGKEETERIAPRGPTKQYSRSIVAGDDWYGSTDPAAHIVERGSVNSPPYMPLHRAAHSLGLKVEDL